MYVSGCTRQHTIATLNLKSAFRGSLRLPILYHYSATIVQSNRKKTWGKSLPDAICLSEAEEDKYKKGEENKTKRKPSDRLQRLSNLN